MERVWNKGVILLLPSQTYLNNSKAVKYTTNHDKGIEELNPNWVTGFVDGEGCFTVVTTSLANNNLSFSIRTKFQIGLHIHEERIINKIKDYFQGIGVIYKDIKNKKIYYTVYARADITNVIIPHFEKYPLQSRKRISYEYWCRIHNNLNIKDYYEDQTKLIEYLKDLPKINSRPISKILLSRLSPEIIKAISVEDKQDTSWLKLSLTCLDPNWIAGFTAGEGHFGVVISKPIARKTPIVYLRFVITQKSDKNLLERIKLTINCGKKN